MVLLLEIFATLAAGLFSGASIYINLVEHPARMQCETAVALVQFAPSYKRATVSCDRGLDTRSGGALAGWRYAVGTGDPVYTACDLAHQSPVAQFSPGQRFS